MEPHKQIFNIELIMIRYKEGNGTFTKYINRLLSLIVDIRYFVRDVN